MTRLFGTDGIRGVARQEPLTAATCECIGRAIARVCKTGCGSDHIVVGRDTRESGPFIETALIRGIRMEGMDTITTGPLPTPGVAFLARSLNACAGIVISASHNPCADNGIKVFTRQGHKIPPVTERQIEGMVADLKGRAGRAEPLPDRTTVTSPMTGAASSYVDFCCKTSLTGLKGMKVVLDCAHGAASMPAPAVFRKLGAEVSVLNAAPDGRNINENVGSEHPQPLAEAVRKAGADAGLAFDGDGDRLVMADETGRVLTGDHLLAAAALFLKRRQRLHNNLLVATVMSNIGLHVSMKAEGIKVLEADVGDRHVADLMLREGAVLGGEQSGHIIFLEHHTTGDGIITAVQLLGMARQAGVPLSRLVSIMTVFPQCLVNVPVSRKPPLATLPKLREAVKQAERSLADRGRVLIRYSGTQPLCRVMVEGPSEAETRRLADSLVETVKTVIG